MRDFNINIFNCENDRDTSEFIDLMHASSFYPTINTFTRITATSRMLTDNIFYNYLTKDLTSGNFSLRSFNLVSNTIITNKNSNKITKSQIEISTFNK